MRCRNQRCHSPPRYSKQQRQHVVGSGTGMACHWHIAAVVLLSGGRLCVDCLCLTYHAPFCCRTPRHCTGRWTCTGCSTLREWHPGAQHLCECVAGTDRLALSGCLLSDSTGAQESRARGLNWMLPPSHMALHMLLQAYGGLAAVAPTVKKYSSTLQLLYCR